MFGIEIRTLSTPSHIHLFHDANLINTRRSNRNEKIPSYDLIDNCQE